MNRRIFGGILTSSLIVLVLASVLIMGFLDDYFSTQYLSQIENESAYIVQGLKDSDDEVAFLDGIARAAGTTNRLTLIAPDGKVLYDNFADASTMENHADRKEVREAVRNGSGVSTRYSSTLAEKTTYYAEKLDNGNIFRISVTHNTIIVMTVGMLRPFLIIIFITLLMSLVIASVISRRIVRPLNEMDLDDPGKIDVYEELAPLIRKIELQNTQIRSQFGELRRQREEFRMITENMTEGFIIADNKADILTYNTSALRMLGVSGDTACRNLYELNRSRPFRTAVEKGLAGEHNVQKLEIGDRICSILANPVFRDQGENEDAQDTKSSWLTPGASSGAGGGTPDSIGAGAAEGMPPAPDPADRSQPGGVVILLIDVTERESNDRMRREFTANVSHELKTPLTSIMGFAELMSTGLAKPDDMKHFAGKIYKEAKHLLDMIGDIIRISRLEENSGLPEREDVDILEAAGKVTERLEQAAAAKHVTLTLGGESVQVSVMRQVLDEVIFNVVENAIKYNVEGGSVSVSVGRTDGGDKPFFTVRDTGRGIAAEDQKRVFERFYRADKAHSGEVEGTGLGLAIVKHGASVMNAHVALESEPGAGTTVTVTFDGDGAR